MRRPTVLLMFLPVLAACAAPKAEVKAGQGPARTQVTARFPPEGWPAGLSVEGRPLLFSVYGEGGETVLFIGGIHGNEPGSAKLARELCRYLERHPGACGGRRVVVAPAVNPDGLAGGTRTNANGVDLNRNYDTWNRRNSKRFGSKPLSEPEARFIVGLIEKYNPDRIVSLHQPIACVDFDGPARDLAEAVSEASGLPLKKIGALPGSLGSYAGVMLKIPILTIELPGDATTMSDEEIWERFGESLLVVIRYPDALM